MPATNKQTIQKMEGTHMKSRSEPPIETLQQKRLFTFTKVQMIESSEIISPKDFNNPQKAVSTFQTACRRANPPCFFHCSSYKLVGVGNMWVSKWPLHTNFLIDTSLDQLGSSMCSPQPTIANESSC